MAQTETSTSPGSLSEVFQSLERVRPSLEKHSPQLVGQIAVLAQKHTDPAMAGSERFRTNTAYAVQDAERLVGPVLPQDHGMREEMDRRAITVPGLTSPTLKHFMAQTPDFRDQGLVDTVRTVSEKIASMGSDQQNNPEIDRVLETLTSRVKNAPRLSAQEAGARSEQPSEQTQQHHTPDPSSSHAPDFDGRPEPPPYEDVPETSGFDPDEGYGHDRHEPEGPTHSQRTEPADSRMHASPGGGASSASQPEVDRPQRPAKAENAAENSAGSQRPEAQAKGPRSENGSKPQNNTGPEKKDKPEAEEEEDQQIVVNVRGPGLFTRLAQAIRPEAVQPVVSTTPNWMSKLQTMNKAHEQRADADHMDQTERLGLKAQSALEAVQNTSASSVMREIADAAKSDPNGMAGVMSEMRPGGRHEGLQSRFQSEQGTNQAFAAQLKEAGEAVAAYGAHRGKAADIGAERGTTAQVEQRFNGLDSKIGELAKGVPGKEAGTSMVEDLSDKAREIIRKAIDLVASVFRPSPSASASASPGL
ncbi:hypothetical protein [Gluconobacter oxydans]|uniref:Uncharacterized protein n=1 Tax=Gluconobacter oxydans TaxID=442 RepID=A0A149S1T1_GLUOY|nr:hypothetical protein [Gluconobacter oxydans]KXV20692.1 hypothetical protein AD934_02940 [Gluconobacter oxydans]